MNHLRATFKTTLTLCLTIMHLVSCGPVPTPTVAGSSHSTSPQPTVSVSTSPNTVTIPPQSSGSQSIDNSLTSSTGVWVQVYFPPSQTTEFQIHSLGSSVTITAIDRLGSKQSKSLPTSQAVHTILFDQLTQGSLTLTFQNPDGSLLGTKESIELGSNQGVIVDFSTQTTPKISPYVFATLQGRVAIPTEISLGSYKAVKEVEDLHEVRNAATTLSDALTLTLDTPRSATLYFGSQVNFKVRAKPGRRYKAYLKVTGGSLPATINYSELVIPDAGKNCTGKFVSCTRYDITVQKEQDVFFSVVQQTGPFRDHTPKKGDYASFTVNVLDVGSSQPETNQELTPSLEAILLNQRYPMDGFSRLNAKEKRYIYFPAQAGKTYTVHLRTNTGDADLWGGRESFFRSNGLKEETSSPGTFDTVNGTALKSNLDPTKRADQKPNLGQFIQNDASGQPDLYYDRVQFRALATERYVFMINAYQASEYAFRVEETGGFYGPPAPDRHEEAYRAEKEKIQSKLNEINQNSPSSRRELGEIKSQYYVQKSTFSSEQALVADFEHGKLYYTLTGIHKGNIQIIEQTALDLFKGLEEKHDLPPLTYLGLPTNSISTTEGYPFQHREIVFENGRVFLGEHAFPQTPLLQWRLTIKTNGEDVVFEEIKGSATYTSAPMDIITVGSTAFVLAKAAYKATLRFSIGLISKLTAREMVTSSFPLILTKRGVFQIVGGAKGKLNDLRGKFSALANKTDKEIIDDILTNGKAYIDKRVDNANNINFWRSAPIDGSDDLIRITTNPEMTRIISAGQGRASSVAGYIEKGEHIPINPYTYSFP